MSRSDERKVALFVPELFGGGAERVMVNIANGLGERGWPVDLILAAARGPYLELVSPKVRIVDLDTGGVARAVPKLARYLRAERPAALLATLSYANVAAVVARLLARTRTPTFLREPSTPSQIDRDTLDLRSRLAELLKGAAYRLADGVVAVSQGAAEDIKRFLSVPAERVHTLYNPVVDGKITEAAKAPVDEPWFAEGEPPVVLGVGRLGPEKDFATLLRAIANVRRERDVRLIILGEGAERASLTALADELGITDDVKLPGFVDNPFSYMARASLYVLSSVREGLPGALIQAMACGTPVVATDCPSGPAEVLERGQYGELVPMRDPTALAAAIVRSLDAEHDRARLIARASVFSVDESIDAYEALLLGAAR